MSKRSHMGTTRKKNNHEAGPLHVKTGDTVMVISGKDKGQTGVVRRVFPEKGKVLVEGLNKVKKAVRPNPMIGQRGGIIEMEAPLQASKVMLYSIQAAKPTRIKHATLDGGKKVRVCKHTNEHLD